MNLDSFNPYTIARKARSYTRKLWVRVALMGLLAFLAIGITQLIEPLVPEKIATRLTGSAADRLLQIIANAMLAVTTFSLTVMVTVYRSSSTQWTPRIHRLIIQDRTTQNTLAVFIGAYVYALLAIILRELGIYVDDRALVLFCMTVIVLAVIVIYLIRWVLHLQSFGSLIDVTRQIEKVTTTCFRERLSTPCLGANPLTGDVPEDAEPIVADQSGYVQHIFPEALNAAAQAHNVDVYLVRNVGSFVFVNEPLAMILRKGAPQDDDLGDFSDVLHANVTLGDVRTFDQDPRFGLISMGEVASKALSPGINDPGTAIDVINRIARILSFYEDETQTKRQEVLSRLHVPPLDPADLLEDGLGAVARDGAAIVEVQQRLQKVFAGLRRHPDPGLREQALVFAKLALQRALDSLDFEPDRVRLRETAHADVLTAMKALNTDT
jgi:uncharacterized membrane protein